MTLPVGVSWLFCPGDRPERYAKAYSIADVVILDLEDGVAAEHKSAARSAISESAPDLDLARTVVRINAAHTDEYVLDLALLRELRGVCVMLAKAVSVADVEAVPAEKVIALCETARGVLYAEAIASARNCAALMWGAEDLVADLGGSSSRSSDGRYRSVASYARNHVLLAAAAAGVPALDAVYLEIADLDGLRTESEDAAASGFAAKVCIHPSQAPVVRSAFTPSEDQLRWARRVLDAVVQPGARGVVRVDGRMVDEPILCHARRLLATAAASTTGGPG
jgi:citrate lyase subunit beta/citryl-CoA lyase